MQTIHQDQFILKGIITRTNNKNEMDPATAKIGPLVQHNAVVDIYIGLAN